MNNTRVKELQYLNQYYNKSGSHLLVLYGQKHIGKTTLLMDFVKDKDYQYYEARYVSNAEQLRLFTDEMDISDKKSETSSYLDIFNLLSGQSASNKRVMIIDEFHKMLKQDVSVFHDIISYMQQKESQDVLFILCTSSVAFVENSLVKKVGRDALSIHGFYKVKELSFTDVLKLFDNYTTDECIGVYSIFGGVPGLLGCFDASLSFKENVMNNILKESCFLHDEALREVSEELRETAVYHTILSNLAAGRYKLNEIYEATGFSRAKISVYLKNLMELEIADKIFSIDTKGKENTQKGIYQIKNNFVHFWFTFLWKNLSRLKTMETDKFYDTYIEPNFTEFCALYFPKICMEYMDALNKQERLPIRYTKSGRWVGKTGNIDFLAVDDKEQLIACFCHYGREQMTYEEYESSLHILKQAKVNATYIYLFSNCGYDERLIQKAAGEDKLKLMTLEDLSYDS